MTRLNEQDARQGRKGTPVLRVLIAALVLCAVVAVALVAYTSFAPAPETGGTIGDNAGVPAAAESSKSGPAATPAPAN